MTRRANARLAGFTFLFYIAVGITSMVLSGRATRGEGLATKLEGMAAHAMDLRVVALLTLLMSLSAVVLGVTLWSITREVDPDLAMLGLACRVVEGVNNASTVSSTMALVWVATATGVNAPDPVAAQGLAAYLMRGGGSSAAFFAVGSTSFCYLLLRGRLIPKALAWLGVVASVVLVIALPVQLLIPFGALAGWLIWMPMLVFELTVAGWFLVKGVAAPASEGTPPGPSAGSMLTA